MGQGFADCRDMDFPRECEDPCALQALGRALAGAMTDGGVVGLDGELGAGKTEFVKGLADGLGCEDIVTSPTFTLLHEYRASAATLYHLDFYRIERAEEIIAVGWDALLEEPGAVVAVEWAGRFPDLLPPDCIRLQLEVNPGGARRVTRLLG